MTPATVLPFAPRWHKARFDDLYARIDAEVKAWAVRMDRRPVAAIADVDARLAEATLQMAISSQLSAAVFAMLALRGGDAESLVTARAHVASALGTRFAVPPADARLAAHVERLCREAQAALALGAVPSSARRAVR